MSSHEDVFCYRPWLHLQVKSSGALKFCCDSDETLYLENGSPARAVAADLNETLNCQKLNEVRKAMLNGEKPSSCKKCWAVEKSNGISLRQKINRRWDLELDRSHLIQTTNSDGSLQEPEIREIEFRLGNLCNLRCRMCGPLNSAKLTEEYFALKKTQFVREDQEVIDLKQNADLFKWHEGPEFLQWMKPYLSKLIDIQFAGGEPFLSPTHVDFLGLLVDTGYAKNITLRYTTNGTVLNPRIIGYWPHFKKITLSVSVDGMDDVYKYIRHGSEWETVLKNIHQLDAMVGKTVSSVTLQPTPNVYNIFSLPRMPRWLLKEFKNMGWATHLNFQTHPSWQSAYILTESEKQKCVELCAEEISQIQNDPVLKQDSRTENILRWLTGLSETLMLQDWTHLRPLFTKNNREMDQYRRTSGDFLSHQFDQLF